MNTANQRIVCFDTETTGLRHQDGHRVIEFAAMVIVNRQITDEVLHLYFNPEREMEAEAFAIHGLSNEFLADKPLFAAHAQAIADFVRDAEVVAHNASFDVGFLNAEFAKLGLQSFNTYCHKVTDTLALARQQFPNKKNSLDALCERFGIDNSHRDLHGALVDTRLLAEVWLALTRGQTSLVAETNHPNARQDENLWPLASTAGLVIYADAHEIAQHEAFFAAK